MKKNISPLYLIKHYFYVIGKKRTRIYFLIPFFGILSAILSLQIPIYVKKIIDALAQKTSTIDVVLKLLWIFIIVRLVAWLLFRLKELITTYQVTYINSFLRNYAFEHLLKHSHSFFINRFSGSLNKKISDYSSAFQTISFQFDSVIIPLIIQLFGATYIIARSDTFIAACFFIGVSFIILFNGVLLKKKAPLNRKVSDTMSTIQGFGQDAISNHSSILLFSQHGNELKMRRELENIWQKNKIKQWIFGDSIYTIQGFVFIVLEFFTIFLSIKGIYAGTISIGDFLMFQFFIIGSLSYVNHFSYTLRFIYEALADAEEMVEILETPHEVEDKVNAESLQVPEGKITFTDMTFAYNQSNQALTNITLEIQKGQKVGLIGPSGAGKSTFVKLLLRFFDVTGGSIQIDGQDIRDVTQDSLHSAIGFVPQDPTLFHRSLIDNIRYGKIDATEEEVIEAAKKAHAHEFISKLPEGYNTLVGERGIKLSGGERQRVAIARAILKNAPILVLDEATSALDSESERLIQDALNILMENKTVIVIAHRLSTIQHMDRILVIDNGRVVEDGNHKTLLENQKSLYAKLWNLQAGGFIVDEE